MLAPITLKLEFSLPLFRVHCKFGKQHNRWRTLPRNRGKNRCGDATLRIGNYGRSWGMVAPRESFSHVRVTESNENIEICTRIAKLMHENKYVAGSSSVAGRKISGDSRLGRSPAIPVSMEASFSTRPMKQMIYRS